MFLLRVVTVESFIAANIAMHCVTKHHPHQRSDHFEPGTARTAEMRFGGDLIFVTCTTSVSLQDNAIMLTILMC